jgi:hypothetical protein
MTEEDHNLSALSPPLVAPLLATLLRTVMQCPELVFALPLTLTILLSLRS